MKKKKNEKSSKLLIQWNGGVWGFISPWRNL